MLQRQVQTASGDKGRMQAKHHILLGRASTNFQCYACGEIINGKRRTVLRKVTERAVMLQVEIKMLQHAGFQSHHLLLCVRVVRVIHDVSGKKSVIGRLNGAVCHAQLGEEIVVGDHESHGSDKLVLSPKHVDRREIYIGIVDCFEKRLVWKQESFRKIGEPFVEDDAAVAIDTVGLQLHVRWRRQLLLREIIMEDIRVWKTSVDLSSFDAGWEVAGSCISIVNSPGVPCNEVRKRYVAT
mmetsp:Transcript_5416/g.9398  ORF Transcript_5416/g.9398 Transcript_5416/m.9398 type:complete len:240 (-) Transcript_5416:620-1339(-)